MAWSMGLLGAAGPTAATLDSDFELLETIVLSSTTSPVYFMGINSYTDYKHLQVRAVIASERAVGNSAASVTFRINDDSTASYARHSLVGDGSSVTAANELNTSFVFLGRTTALTDSFFTPLVIDILDFNSNAKNKTIKFLTGINGTETQVRLSGGLWTKSDPVESIRLGCEGSFRAGSRFSLYGVK